MPSRGVWRKPKKIAVVKEKNGLVRLKINFVETLMKPSEFAMLKRQVLKCS